MERTPKGQSYPHEYEVLPLAQLQEKCEDLRKELHIYLRVLPMQNAIRATLAELLQDWQLVSWYIGYRQAELDRQPGLKLD